MKCTSHIFDTKLCKRMGDINAWNGRPRRKYEHNIQSTSTRGHATTVIIVVEKLRLVIKTQQKQSEKCGFVNVTIGAMVYLRSKRDECFEWSAVILMPLCIIKSDLLSAGSEVCAAVGNFYCYCLTWRVTEQRKLLLIRVIALFPIFIISYRLNHCNHHFEWQHIIKLLLLNKRKSNVEMAKGERNIAPRMTVCRH